jgi:hypothetical protein
MIIEYDRGGSLSGSENIRGAVMWTITRPNAGWTISHDDAGQLGWQVFNL